MFNQQQGGQQQQGFQQYPQMQGMQQGSLQQQVMGQQQGGFPQQQMGMQQQQQPNMFMGGVPHPNQWNQQQGGMQGMQQPQQQGGMMGMQQGGQMGQQMPAGNWIQSARNYRVQNGYLLAELKNQHGQWVQAKTKMPVKSLENINGQFRRTNYPSQQQGGMQQGGMMGMQQGGMMGMQQGGMQGGMMGMQQQPQQMNQMPPGSWVNSARNQRIQNGWLFAELRNQHGQWVQAKTKMPVKSLENINGQFRRTNFPSQPINQQQGGFQGGMMGMQQQPQQQRMGMMNQQQGGMMGMQQQGGARQFQGRLNANGVMRGGETLMAENGAQFRFVVQTDGNMVVYNGQNQPLWASNTNGAGQGPYTFKVQGDNNLCLYAEGQGGCVWASDTWKKGGENGYLRLQDDGNLVFYSQGGQPVWCSRTNGGKRSPHFGKGEKCM